MYGILPLFVWVCHMIAKPTWLMSYRKTDKLQKRKCRNISRIPKVSPSLKPITLQPMTTAFKEMTPPLTACYFNSTKTLPGMLPVKRMEPLQAKQTKAPCRELWVGPHAASQTFTHIYVCREQQWLTHKHTLTYTARYPARRPLTWTCCSHSAIHKSLGSQQQCWPSVPCWTWLHGNKSP